MDYARLFLATFDHAPVGIAHVAPDGRWLRINRKLCEIVGYSAAELQRLTFQDITHPDDLEPDLALVQRVLIGEIDRYELEKRYIRKSGELVWIKLTVSLVRDDLGLPDFFISVVENIQARKEAEEALRVSEAQLRVIFNNLDVGIITSSLDGDLLNWNRAALAMHEWGSVEEVRRHLADFVQLYELRTPGGRSLPLSDWPMVRVMGGESLVGEVLEVRRRDREWSRMFRYGGALARDEQGKSMLAMLTMVDISEQRLRESLYRQAMAMYSYGHEGMAVTDLHGVIRAINPSFTTLTGYRDQDVLGRNITMLHVQEAEPVFDSHLLAALLATGSWQGTIKSRFHDGELRLQKVTIYSVLDENNNAPVSYVWVMADSPSA